MIILKRAVAAAAAALTFAGAQIPLASASARGVSHACSLLAHCVKGIASIRCSRHILPSAENIHHIVLI